MKNSGSKSKLIVAILIVPVIVLSAVICAAQGIIITLKNTGPSPITKADLDFDLKPLDPGQTTDLTVGTGLPYSIGDFQIGVIPISEDNPLAPGETACVGPLYQLTSGDYVEFVEVESFGNGITSSPPMGVFKIIPDVTRFPFDVPHDGVQGGRIAGVFRFLSSVPDSCKTAYAPPFGMMMINSGAALSDSTSAEVSLSCYPTVGYSCQEMQFSNDNINWSAPEPYKRNKTWFLSPGDGEKTVYVRFKDSAGNWSNAYSDTIVLRASTLTQIRSFPIPAFPDPDINIRGLAFGDGKLFAINKFYDRSTQSDKAKIYVLDPANGNILNSFPAPPYVSDLASDGVNLYVNTYSPAVGDILKLDSTTGSILATIHPSGVSITSGINIFIGGLAFLNSDIFQVVATENCGRDSIVRLNTEDGSFLGCFNSGSFGFSYHELDSDGTNLLHGTRVKDTVYPGTYFWAVFTLSPSGSLLKSDTILLSQNPDVFSDVFEAWGDKQLFVVDRRSNKIIVFQFPSTIGVVPTSMNFGQVIAGSASAPQTITISNPGSANLVIKSIDTTGADAGMFDVATGGPKPCSSLTPTIASGEDCTVNVTFSPTSTLKKTAVLGISSAGPNENPVVNMSLNGTGINTAGTVITPNGGEIIPSGSTYAIQWGAPSNAVMFDLKYSINNGSTWKTLASKVTGTSYDWYVHSPSNNKTSCLVKAIGFDSSGRKVGEDISDSAFAIEVVKVTSPDEGEILKSGNARAITWRTNATIRPVTSVKLFYSINGGASWKPIIPFNTNPGSYYWTVPNVSSSSCKVKVLLKDAGGATVGNDVSDGFFTIQP